jgi:hypothetical protein
MVDILDKVTGYLQIGLVALVGYFVWSNWSSILAGFCKIPGAAATGWCGDSSEALKCNLTMNDCWKQDPYATVDVVNCKCILPNIDPPQTCVPPKMWDTILKKCIDPVSPGMVKCLDGSYHYPGFCPVPVEEQWIACDDGSYVKKPAVCPPYNPPVSEYWSCLCRDAVMDISKIEATRLGLKSCGEVCDYFPGSGGSGNDCAGIQVCPNGSLVDLCNPPGITLDDACGVNFDKPSCMEQRSCIADCQEGLIGGGGCGLSESFIASKGWVSTPGAPGCAMSPNYHQCWDNCGGFDNWYAQGCDK